MARLILLLLLLDSLTLATNNAWFPYRSPLGTMFVERSENENSVRLERLLAREVTSASVRSASPSCWQRPRAVWAAIDAVDALAAAQEVPVPPEVGMALAMARATERGWRRANAGCTGRA